MRYRTPNQPPNPLRRSLCLTCGLAAAALVLAFAAPSSADAERDRPAAMDKDKDGDVYRHKLYTRYGKDPTFKELLKRKAFPVGKNSDKGVKGSRIDVNNKAVERAKSSRYPIPKNIKIHTICHSAIKRDEFDRWTRWYQEDGNTQVFRMFKDEHNVRNKRPDAGRVESFSDLKWKRGKWHAWEGTYLIIKAHNAMIFQAKNNDNEWGVSINMNDKGDIRVNHRRHQQDETIARGMIGKPFILTIHDNGHDYKVFLNREQVAEGHYARPTGTTSFRWGMYGKTFRHDAMLFVSGVRFE